MQRYQDEDSLDDLLTLIRQSDAGNKAALERLRETYTVLPELAGKLTSLQHYAEQDTLCSLQPGARETSLAQATNMRKKLSGENPSPMEQLLVNRVVLDWLHALEADRHCTLRPGESRPLALSEFYEKQADRAHRRLMRSTKTLAEIRKLLRPTLQVNIADKQVNVAGDVHTGAKEAAA